MLKLISATILATILVGCGQQTVTPVNKYSEEGKILLTQVDVQCYDRDLITARQGGDYAMVESACGTNEQTKAFMDGDYDVE